MLPPDPALVAWSTVISNIVCGLGASITAYAAVRIYLRAISQDVRAEVAKLRQDLKL